MFTIGQSVLARFEQVLVPCRVVAVKNAYGHDRVQVEPVNGIGRQWVDASRVGPGGEDSI